MSLARAAGCAGWLALLGCDALVGGPRCRLGAEHVIARTAEKEIDALALVSVGRSAVAVWSEPSGAFARTLSALGQPLSPAVRIGERCAGGLSALAGREPGTFDFACSMPASARGPGKVSIRRLGASLATLAEAALEPASAQSEGVDLAHAGARLAVLFHDGSAESQRVLFAALDASYGLAEPPRAISDPGRVTAYPRLRAREGAPIATWLEKWVEGEALRSRVVRWQPATGARTLLEPADLAAMPELLPFDGRMVLAVRHRPRGAKTGLYVAFVGEQALDHAELERVGRADGNGRPALTPCMGGIAAATPRTYGGDYFIGFNWLDPELRRPRGEQQYYEDSHAFTQVASACFGTHALLFIAEFPQLERKSSALRALPYRCE